MHRPPGNWQLPDGVDRHLWDYVHDAALARNYDASLSGSSLVQVDQAFAEEHCTRPGRLIDLGCGTGRVLLPFARRGYWVLGVDLSEAMLRVVGDKTAAAGVTVHRLKANLTNLGGLAAETFDYAVCLFSTLGMVRGTEQRRRMVAEVFRLLRPGGTFIVHVHNRLFNIWNGPGRRWLIRDALRRLVGRAETGDRVMPPHQGLAGLTLHLFRRREAVRLLEGAGFRILEVRPVSLRPDGRVPWPAWFGAWRAYGYLIAAQRPRN